MGSHSCLTTTQGIWQHTILTLYFNPSQGKFQPAKGGGRQDIPHPPIWTGDTFCLGDHSGSRRPPWGLQAVLPSSCSATAFSNSEGMSEQSFFVSSFHSQQLFQGALLTASPSCGFGQRRGKKVPGERMGCAELVVFSWKLPSPKELQSWVISGEIKDETPQISPCLMSLRK